MDLNLKRAYILRGCKLEESNTCDKIDQKIYASKFLFVVLLTLRNFPNKNWIHNNLIPVNTPTLNTTVFLAVCHTTITYTVDSR